MRNVSRERMDVREPWQLRRHVTDRVRPVRRLGDRKGGGAMPYPVGVTGNEYRIAGPDYEQELEQQCPNCGDENCLFELGYRRARWVFCWSCNWNWDFEGFEGEDINLPSYDDLHDADEIPSEQATS